MRSAFFAGTNISEDATIGFCGGGLEMESSLSHRDHIRGGYA